MAAGYGCPMQERPDTEPVETVTTGYTETQPASAQDVERARDQQELLASSPGTTSDRSLEGETAPLEFGDVEGPTVATEDD